MGWTDRFSRSGRQRGRPLSPPAPQRTQAQTHARKRAKVDELRSQFAAPRPPVESSTDTAELERRERIREERQAATRQLRRTAEQQADARREKAVPHVPRTVDAEFGGVTLGPGTISYKGEQQALAGVTATVETAGQIRRRFTATRLAAGTVALGPIGFVLGAMARKKVDDRELYLLIDGPHYAWSVAVDPAMGAQAREFAARIHTAGKK